MLGFGLAVLAFGMGALPFAVWLGRLALRGQDVRQYGDGNPGATNAMRAGGWRLGLAVLMLDVSKAALPVGLAQHVFLLNGAETWLVSTAVMLGHAYSPFLQGKGGKALAVMLGVWIGLTLGEMAVVVLVLLVFWYALLAVDGWAVLLTAAGGLLYLLVFHFDWLLVSVMLVQILLVMIKQRADLAKPLTLRQWLLRRVQTP